MVLSGMSTLEQMKDNLSFMKDFKPLTEEEHAAVKKVCDIIHSKNLIPCTACRYCMPCPAGIEINTCADKSLLLRRSPSANQLTEGGQAMMKKIEGCLHCGACMKKCPYGLNTPKLLEENYEDYKNVLAGKTLV